MQKLGPHRDSISRLRDASQTSLPLRNAPVESTANNRFYINDRYESK